MEQLIEDEESKQNNKKAFSIKTSTPKARCFRLCLFIMLILLNITSIYLLIKQLHIYSSYKHRISKLQRDFTNTTQSIRRTSNSIQIQNEQNMELSRELSVLESSYNIYKKTLKTLELQHMAIKTIYNKPQPITKLIKTKQQEILEIRSNIDELSAFKITNVKIRNLNANNMSNDYLLSNDQLKQLSQLIGKDIKGSCYNSHYNGYSGKVFYENCSHYHNIVIVIHHLNNIVFGGVIPFKMNAYKGKVYCDDVYLFNLNKGNVYYVKKGKYAIEINENSFPIFGKNDIYLDSDSPSDNFSNFPQNFNCSDLLSLTNNVRNFDGHYIEALII